MSCCPLGLTLNISSKTLQLIIFHTNNIHSPGMWLVVTKFYVDPKSLVNGDFVFGSDGTLTLTNLLKK